MKSRAKLTILLIFGCFVFLFTACTPTPCAPTFDVTKPEDTNDGDCTAGDCSLREAVLKANTCPGPQTINLPADGYILSLDGDNEDQGATGDLDVTDDLIIIGTGAPSINGNIERAFHIHSGVTAEFNGIWLTDGDAIIGGGLINEGTLLLSNFTCNYNNVSIPPGGMGDARGGCIFNTEDLTINNGHFLGNTAGYGGAIYNMDHTSALIENSSFTGNEVDFNGGALWNGVDAEYTVNNTTFDMNEAGIDGGAIWNHGDFFGEGLIIEDNLAADRGGGIFVWMDTMTVIENSWVTDNTAHWGGGLYNDNGMVHFYQSGFSNNTATGPVGGGIYNNGPIPGGGLLLRNVTVSGNTANGGVGGGGVYNTGNFDFRFVTIAENNPEGLRVDTGVEILLRSSIIADNSVSDCAGMTPGSVGYNIIGDGSCALLSGTDLVGVDPLLEPLGFHGGTAPSHPLGVGSPAIDSGTPDVCISTDQNYTSRPQGLLCDRGAFENEYELGILRGWTFIDANRNDFRDATDGSMSGVIMELKEGLCPGGAVVETTTSASGGGFYEMVDIDPGDYCIDTSPLQQTMYPEYIDVSFAPGDILEDVNFRYLLSPLGESSISGNVWHDECAVPYGSTTTPPPGCISLPGGGFGADGIYDTAEPGIEGIKVKVYAGACPGLAPSISAEVYTDGNGDYTVPALGAGTWCVHVNAVETPNDTILIPGNWTYPVRNASPAELEVSLGSGEEVVDVNFGWDYQFLPEPMVPYSYLCTANARAFIRRGPGTDGFEPIGDLELEEPFEVKAKSEQEEPLWFFGKSKRGTFGWVSASVLDCKELDPSKLLVEMTPLRIYTPTPVPPATRPLECSRSLNQSQCISAGGRWMKETCICPTPVP